MELRFSVRQHPGTVWVNNSCNMYMSTDYRIQWSCARKRWHFALKRDSTRQLSMDKLNFYWCQNRYKMVQFTKEIMMLLGASLAVMWFPLWFCLFNMHLSVQCTSCRWPEGIQSEKSSLAIMCCLLYQRVQFRYRCPDTSFPRPCAPPVTMHTFPEGSMVHKTRTLRY